LTIKEKRFGLFMVAGGIHDYIWFELVFVFFMVVNGSTMEKCLSMNHRGLANGLVAIAVMVKWLEASSHSLDRLVGDAVPSKSAAVEIK
jgi:hypothetical protein